MSFKLIVSLAVMVVGPAVVSATTFQYYRSVFCDTQSSDFLTEGYASPIAMSSDKMCHQTPQGTMAMKIGGGLEENCVILAYDDYTCASLVGSVPASGKCVAATKARIGSWQAVCNVTSPAATSSSNSESTSYTPGELKRRSKARLPSPRDDTNATTTKDDTKTASSIVSEISAAISASSGSAITTNPSAGAALSSAIGSGTILAEDYNLTSYVTEATPLPSMTTTAGPGCGNGTNGSYTSPSITTTATYTGTKGGNGTMVLAHGGAASLKVEGLNIVLGGLAIVMGMMSVF